MGMKTQKNSLSFHSFEDLNLDEIKVAEPSVAAGFPSPADDFIEMEINLQDYIVKNILIVKHQELVMMIQIQITSS